MGIALNFLLLIYFKIYDIFYTVIYVKIVFVRHGDPDYVNDSLTEKGFREAEILKTRISKMDVAEFYCSPLGRAIRTSEPTLKLMNRKAEILSWLKEFPGTVIDPKTGEKRIPWDLMPSYWTKDSDFYDKDKWIETPLMQSGDTHTVYKDVCEKLDNFLANHGYVRNGNCYKAEKPNKDTIVFFCHFGITAVLLSHILGLSPVVLWQGFVALPTSVTTIRTEEREEGIAYFRCRGFGDVSHLYEAGETPSNSACFCELFTDKDERH